MTLKSGADFVRPAAPTSQDGQSRTQKMSDKLKSVVVFGSVRMVEAGDKLQFVGRLLSLPAVSRAIALPNAPPIYAQASQPQGRGYERCSSTALLARLGAVRPKSLLETGGSP